MKTQTAEEFTPTHHALMMAWISRAVVDAVGEEEGERIIRQAVVRYGNQRGRRMAMRVEANGHPLTVGNYLAYAETRVGKGKMQTKLLERSPHGRTQVFERPWYVGWAENGLMEYGRYFCMEIDRASSTDSTRISSSRSTAPFPTGLSAATSCSEMRTSPCRRWWVWVGGWRSVPGRAW